MTPTFLQQVERAFWDAARDEFGDMTTRRRAIAQAIKEVSRQYNDLDSGAQGGDRGSRIGADARIHDLARMLFFTLADLPKIAYPLAELYARQQIPPDHLRVLDVGAGYGSLSLGLAGLLDEHGASGAVEIDAIDRDPTALKLLPGLFEACAAETGWRSRIDLRVHPLDLARPVPELAGRYDLILAGSVLCELERSRALPLVQDLLSRLSPTGHLILLEPALRMTSRRLLELRDAILAPGDTDVFAPCTRPGPCPALLDERNWCHERRVWQHARELRSLTVATGLRRRDLKWSYLTLNRHGATVARNTEAWRVVSMPMKSKGKQEVFVCGGPGRTRLVRLNRHRAPRNASFKKLDRGVLVTVDGAAPIKGGLRVERDTEISAEDPGKRS